MKIKKKVQKLFFFLLFFFERSKILKFSFFFKIRNFRISIFSKSGIFIFFSSTFHFLDSYGHTVYENKREFGKKDFRKIFSEWSKISTFSFSENPDFHRSISESYTSLFHLKHSAIDRSRPQLSPGMFFVANGCLTVENELSEVEEISDFFIFFD